MSFRAPAPGRSHPNLHFVESWGNRRRHILNVKLLLRTDMFISFCESPVREETPALDGRISACGPQLLTCLLLSDQQSNKMRVEKVNHQTCAQLVGTEASESELLGVSGCSALSVCSVSVSQRAVKVSVSPGGSSYLQPSAGPGNNTCLRLPRASHLTGRTHYNHEPCSAAGESRGGRKGKVRSPSPESGHEDAGSNPSTGVLGVHHTAV